MTQLTISFSDEENNKLEFYTKKWKMAKYQVVREMIREYREVKNEER